MDGNHECYPYLADLPVTERWGGNVQVYPDYPHIIILVVCPTQATDGVRSLRRRGAVYAQRCAVRQEPWTSLSYGL